MGVSWKLLFLYVSFSFVYAAVRIDRICCWFISGICTIVERSLKYVDFIDLNFWLNKSVVVRTSLFFPLLEAARRSSGSFSCCSQSLTITHFGFA